MLTTKGLRTNKNIAARAFGRFGKLRSRANKVLIVNTHWHPLSLTTEFLFLQFYYTQDDWT